MKVCLPYGDAELEVSLPERARILEPPPPLAPLPDPEATLREALARPIAHEPLAKLVGPKSRVTIAFDDPCIPALTEEWRPGRDFRELAISYLLGELERLGVRRERITLLCANALHRKWTRGELATVLGKRIAQSFPPQRLYCHDAEDGENLCFLGETERGMEVEVNRAVVESDQLIYVNLTGTPFNGGWKSVAVGLSSFRSIRHHHRPFPGASGKSVMDPHRSSFQKLLWELGGVIEKELARRGRRVLTIESVHTNRPPQRLAGVFAGHPPEAHLHTLELVERQMVVEAEGQCDVLLFGLPNRDFYSTLSRMNPILARNLGLSYGFGMFQNRPLLREGGFLILAHPFERTFHPLHFPSYVELFEKVLPDLRDPFELWDLFAEDFAHRAEFVHAYRYRCAYHGVHPLILYGQGAHPLRHIGRVLVAGSRDDEAVRRMGFEPFPTFEAALAEAEASLGRDCSLTYVPTPPSTLVRVNGAGG